MKEISLLISIATDGDRRELDALRIELLEELAMLPINAIEPVRSGQAPTNTRGIGETALGELLASFGADAVKTVVSTIRAWFQRSTARSIELTIDGDRLTLGKASVREQERLVNLFVERHLASK